MKKKSKEKLKKKEKRTVKSQMKKTNIHKDEEEQQELN